MNRALHPEATAEVLEAIGHYAEIAPALGGRFYDEISELMYDVCLHPRRYRTFDSPVRRVLAHSFPYAVMYVAQSDRVWIIAVMHLKRRPGYWKRRLKS